MQVHIEKSDIASLSVDAVVIAINSEGVMLGADALSVRSKGGANIETESKEAAPIAIGAAIITHSGQLPAKHCIHVPIIECLPGTNLTEAPSSSAEIVRRAARAALLGASAHKLSVIAIPALGLDNGVAAEDIARCIIEELRTHKKDFPEQIYLVSKQDKMVEAFEYALGFDAV